jgi:hypothetical protein
MKPPKLSESHMAKAPPLRKVVRGKRPEPSRGILVDRSANLGAFLHPKKRKR